MLTSNSTNRLDTLDTAQSLACLLSELMGGQGGGGGLHLSPVATDGMVQIIDFLRGSVKEAVIGLEQAQDAVAEAEASAERIDGAYRRGYGDGFTVGAQSAPISDAPSGRETLKWWARAGCSAGYHRGLRRRGIHDEDAYREISEISALMVDDAFDVAAAGEPRHPPVLDEDGPDHRADDAPAADNGPIPDLTEPLAEAEPGGSIAVRA